MTRRLVPLAVILGAALLGGCSSPADPASGSAVAATDIPASSQHPTATPRASTSGTAGPGETLAAGTWGGEGAVLRIAEDGAAALEFDCATGSLSEPPSIRADGSLIETTSWGTPPLPGSAALVVRAGSGAAPEVGRAPAAPAPADQGGGEDPGFGLFGIFGIGAVLVAAGTMVIALRR